MLEHFNNDVIPKFKQCSWLRKIVIGYFLLISLGGLVDLNLPFIIFPLIIAYFVVITGGEYTPPKINEAESREIQNAADDAYYLQKQQEEYLDSLKK